MGNHSRRSASARSPSSRSGQQPDRLSLGVGIAGIVCGALDPFVTLWLSLGPSIRARLDAIIGLAYLLVLGGLALGGFAKRSPKCRAAFWPVVTFGVGCVLAAHISPLLTLAFASAPVPTATAAMAIASPTPPVPAASATLPPPTASPTAALVLPTPTAVPRPGQPAPAGYDATAEVVATYGVYPTGAPLEQGQRLLRKWRLVNTGSEPWEDGFTWSFDNLYNGGLVDAQPGDYPVGEVAPGGHVDVEILVTARDVAGQADVRWQMRDPFGNTFGCPSYLHVQVLDQRAPAESTLQDCACVAAWAGEDEHADDPPTALVRGKVIWKVWRIHNEGHCPWDSHYKIVPAEGERVTESAPVQIPYTPPGGFAEVIVGVRVPGNADLTGEIQTEWWQILDPQGGRLSFPQSSLKFVVVDEKAPGS